MMKRVVAAVGVIWNEGRVLITRRAEDVHLGGLWEFPGGKVEPGEDPEVTVTRECKEECGLDVKVARILDVASHRDSEREVRLLFYECALQTHARLDVTASEYRWVTPRELDGYTMPPANARVRRLIAGGQTGGHH